MSLTCRATVISTGGQFNAPVKLYQIIDNDHRALLAWHLQISCNQRVYDDSGNTAAGIDRHGALYHTVDKDKHMAWGQQ